MMKSSIFEDHKKGKLQKISDQYSISGWWMMSNSGEVETQAPPVEQPPPAPEVEAPAAEQPKAPAEEEEQKKKKPVKEKKQKAPKEKKPKAPAHPPYFQVIIEIRFVRSSVWEIPW